MPESAAPAGLPAWWPHAERSRAVDAGGLRWHVQRWPREPDAAPVPVALLLHGTGSSAHSWRALAPLLAPQFDVIAPDLPGHAFTETPLSQSLALPAVAQALSALLGVLAVQPALIVGHSAGAAIAMQMVLGGAVAPRLTVSINGAILPLQGPLGRLFLPLARVLAANPLVAPAFTTWAALPPVTRRLLDSTGSRLDALGERCYAHLVSLHAHAAGALRLMASWDLEPLAQALPHWRGALLLLSSSNDRTLPPSHARRVQARLPQARLVEMPDGGHLVHEEDAPGVLLPLRQAWDAAAR